MNERLGTERDGSASFQIRLCSWVSTPSAPPFGSGSGLRPAPE
jgi:hypothetical protein